MKICRRFHISGRVQGVWFRAWTRQQAQQLELLGYAKNLADGRVEVLACGSEARVAELQQRLWQGPIQARVDDMQTRTLPYQEAGDFIIL